jgi:hypothetical protein
MKALFIILDCNCPCANPQLNTEDWIIVGTGAAFIIAALCGLAWLSLKQRKAPKEVSAHDQRINADRKLIEQYKEQMRVRRGFAVNPGGGLETQLTLEL